MKEKLIFVVRRLYGRYRKNCFTKEFEYQTGAIGFVYKLYFSSCLFSIFKIEFLFILILTTCKRFPKIRFKIISLNFAENTHLCAVENYVFFSFKFDKNSS